MNVAPTEHGETFISQSTLLVHPQKYLEAAIKACFEIKVYRNSFSCQYYLNY